MVLDTLEMLTREFQSDVEYDIEKYAIMKDGTYHGGNVKVLRENAIESAQEDENGNIIKRRLSDKYVYVIVKFIINDSSDDTDKVPEIDYKNYERLYSQCLTTVLDGVYRVKTVREGVLTFRNAGIYLATIMDGADDGLPELHLLVSADIENRKRQETFHQLNRIFKLFVK